MAGYLLAARAAHLFQAVYLSSLRAGECPREEGSSATHDSMSGCCHPENEDSFREPFQESQDRLWCATMLSGDGEERNWSRLYKVSAGKLASGDLVQVMEVYAQPGRTRYQSRSVRGREADAGQSAADTTPGRPTHSGMQSAVPPTVPSLTGTCRLPHGCPAVAPLRRPGPAAPRRTHCEQDDPARSCRRSATWGIYVMLRMVAAALELMEARTRTVLSAWLSFAQGLEISIPLIGYRDLP
jgi:hypothetical protein